MSEEICLMIVFMVLSASMGVTIGEVIVPVIWDFIKHILERRQERINRKMQFFSMDEIRKITEALNKLVEADNIKEKDND